MPCLSCCWKKTAEDKEDAIVDNSEGDDAGNFKKKNCIGL